MKLPVWKLLLLFQCKSNNNNIDNNKRVDEDMMFIHPPFHIPKVGHRITDTRVTRALFISPEFMTAV